MVCLLLCICVGFAAMMGRTALLSAGTYTAANAAVYGGREARVVIASARGSIYDVNGQHLAGGEYVQACLVDPLSLTAQSRAALLGSAKYESEAGLAARISRGLPFMVCLNAPVSGRGLTGILARRRYPDLPLAQNLLGYVGADGHGVGGVEAAFDPLLSAAGDDYTAVFRTDAARRALPGLGIRFEGEALPAAGGVTLTINAGIQQVAERVADKYIERGAVVVIEVSTGRIAALVSRPTYSAYDVAAALDTPAALLIKPFEEYCCGSAFKIVVTAAALEGGVDTGAQYICTGAYETSSGSLACGKRDGHGTLSLERAFSASCNTYFCDLAARVGAQGVLTAARAFGLGRGTEFWMGLRSRDGQLPDEADLSAPAALANLAIGQGELLITPVQAACMAGVVASGGIYVPPTLVAGTVSGDGVFTPMPAQAERRVISAATAEYLRVLMVQSTISGTGTPARPAMYGAGVKTSSAQTGIYEDGEELLHTWTCGFFPGESPQYAVAVLVEGGVSGYSSAAPVFAALADGMTGAGFVASP